MYSRVSVKDVLLYLDGGIVLKKTARRKEKIILTVESMQSTDYKFYSTLRVFCFEKYNESFKFLLNTSL